ncbi:protein translocase subunit SecF [Candidatus Bathyarchaeota archaeon]|nr:MAG: protein translocase subunit SecF [Candidatus Bathyarchaeota archaeon]
MQFLANTNWNFLGKKKIAFAISGLLILASVVAIIINKGPIYNIDFKGGQVLEIGFGSVVDIGKVRDIVEATGIKDAEIQSIGDGSVVLFRVPADVEFEGGISVTDAITEQLKTEFGEESLNLRRQEIVGPKVSNELRKQALWATLIALVGILIYVSIRFKFRFGIAAVIALFHDVIITIGIFTILGREFSLPVVAAILTIVGYSINDTIVISDRIRENIRILYREKFEDLVNRSLNQTISRTIITSLVVLIVLLCIFFFGGPVIHDFSLALIIGVIIGTYSSVYVVSPIVVAWEHASPKKVGGKR